MVGQATAQQKVLQVETRDIEPVPDNEKHGSPRGAFTVWFGANMSMATWVVGSLGPVLATTACRGLASAWRAEVATPGDLGCAGAPEPVSRQC
jgi:cytosine/uracil/thiamine/allantoin permease